MAYDGLPLVVAQGGTGNTFNNGGFNPILGGATSTGNFLASGNNPTGQALVTNGASIKGVYRAVNCWKLLNTKTPTTSTALNFTSLMSATYTLYALVVNGLVPNTGTPAFKMQFSTNNGSSYLATGYQSGFNRIFYNTTTYTNSNSTTEMLLTAPTSTSFATNGIFYITSGGFCFGASGNGNTCGNTVSINPGITVNAFTVYFTSGTFSGTLSLYGINTTF
ncbi:MAG: hypothetical protein EPO02_13190 [Nitrospirae bacterium]|nr:MAG: hypothetical protein EPO02_13190 [Nitrospirota bacterium]